MNTKRAFLFTSLIAVTLTAVTLVTAGNSLMSVAGSVECSYHHGYHYERKDPTAAHSGWQEFWACCDCNRQYLTRPEGEWLDGDEEAMTGGVGVTHVAYLAPLEDVTINLYKNTYELSVGDKATIMLDEDDDNVEAFGTLSYVSDSENVSVSHNGIITANSLGSATITVMGKDKGVASLTVSVVDTDRVLGFDKINVLDTTYEYPETITDREEFNYAVSLSAVYHYRYVKLHMALTETLVFSDIANFYEMRDVSAYLCSTTTIPVRQFGSAASLSQVSTTEQDIYVSFIYRNIDYDWALASTTSDVNGHEATELVNAESEIRRYQNSLKPSSVKRGNNFLDFPIESKNTKGYMDVYNSEELWWSVTNGFIPRFPLAHSSAEEIYERAKDVLRKEITDDMSDIEKMLAIYDYISENLRYDYEALDCDYWLENTAWYLEGPTFHGRCVCDAFSRYFALLCNIEGLGVDRGSGYTDSGGHAWNYVPYDGDWYLMCTTWAQSHVTASNFSSIQSMFNIETPYFEITSYNTFMADLLYMEGEGYSRDIKDAIHNSHDETKSQRFYTVNSYAEGCDFNIDSTAEVAAICELVHEIGLTQFYIPCLDTSSIMKNKLATYLAAAGYTVKSQAWLTSNSDSIRYCFVSATL